MPFPLLNQRHYQNAYVTADTNAAIAALTPLGLEFFSFENEMEITTTKGTALGKTKLSFAWGGGIQYELIEPISGNVDLYSEGIAPGRPLSFHHIAMQVEDWDALVADVKQRNAKIALQGQSGDALKFLYVDARDTLGHYLEYVWATPERWKQIGVIR